MITFVIKRNLDGKIDGTLVVDLGKNEDNFGESDVPIAITHRDKEIVLLQMDGLLTKEQLEEDIQAAIDASEQVYQEQARALKNSYEKGERGKLKM